MNLPFPFPFRKPLALLGAVSLAVVPTLRGQDVPKSSLARQILPPEVPTEYNIKVGQIFLRFNARLREEFVDNINLSSGKVVPIETDLITTPELRVDATWAITKLNTLRFNTTFSAAKYSNHPELDSKTLLLAPNSEIAYDILIGDFRLQLHERFSLQDDAVAESVNSSAAKLTRFINTIGGSILWDLNDLKLSIGYDHSNFLALGATDASGTTNTSLGTLNRSTDQISAFAVAALSSSLGGGVEATAAATRYPLAPENDDKRVTLGPFLSTQLTRYTKVDVALGYQIFSSDVGNVDMDRSQAIDPLLVAEKRRIAIVAFRPPAPSGNLNSFYATLRIDHRLNRFYTDSLTCGHESQTGIFGQQTMTNYCKYVSSWLINPRTVLDSILFYESVMESGTLASNPFSRYGSSFEITYQVTRRCQASVYFEHTQKTSQSEEFTYTQNKLGMMINYRF